VTVTPIALNSPPKRSVPLDKSTLRLANFANLAAADGDEAFVEVDVALAAEVIVVPGRGVPSGN
jgi:hypothetical protein